MNNETIYQSAISSMQEGVMLQYTNGKIGICNASAKKILKLTDKPCNFNKQKIICENGSLLKKEHSPIQISLHTGKEYFNEILGIYRTDDSLVWISLNSKPLFRDDKVYAVLITFVDITKRRQAEKTLKNNEHRYKAIIQDQTELICRYLPDGLLSFVNNAYCRYFGKTEAELIGHHLTPFSFDDLQDILIQIMEELTQENPVTETENSTISPSGKERWQHWIVRAMFNEKGELFEYQAVGRDITERNQAEKELRRAKEEAEAATKAKSEFLANMSHEIRTPMNGVVGMAELLINTELSPKQYEYAQIILQSTDALQTLINDILDFSKIEAGKLSLESGVFDLEAAILEVARLLSMTAESKGFELIVRYAPGAPHFFVGDAGRIRQILTNLVGNAIKFTNVGHVLINAECQGQTSNRMKIQIEDTGIGIPADKINNIFYEFTQADASTTRQFGGTGLGLAISQQLVKMMGGEIGVVSELNKGSTFTFTIELPLAKTQPENIPKYAQIDNLEKYKQLKNSRILIVDDNTVNQRILQEQLENLQIHTKTVATAEDALQALRADSYWLAIIDYFMPIMDGEQLGKIIKQDSAIKDTILIMLSSAGYQQESYRLKETGFSGHLIKPLSQNQLHQTLLSLRFAFEQKESSEFITMEKVDKLKFKYKTYSNISALLVEDNDVNRLVAKSMLEQIGCKVTQVIDGIQALKAIEQETFDIIFMDINMPGMDGFETTKKIRELKSKNIIVAMTANAMQGDAEKCLAKGMDAYISKPVDLERIFNVIKQYYPDNQTSNKAKLPNCSNLQVKKILLVEDNPVNRFVTVNILEKIGCWVEIAENGKQAVRVCQNKKYDLILMDISMPIMDGIEATSFIRQQDKNTPIVATTTSCQPDDIKNYLSVGMNSCLPKPVTIENLTLTVEKYTSFQTNRTEQIEVQTSDKTEINSLPIFDPIQAKRIAIGNIEILHKIIDKFTQDTPNQLQKLQIALQSSNQKDVERLAHSLKGSARSVGASRLGEVAFDAENFAKQGNLKPVKQKLFSGLQKEFKHLKNLWKQTDWDKLL
ncbi:response regulator [Thiotrichales bacterium HSG1]|nr:response regulator [Thiotrichales bacterium HSG1]